MPTTLNDEINAVVVLDDVRQSMELLEKMDNGEINFDELEKGLSEIPEKEKPEPVKEPKKERELLKVKEVDAEPEIEDDSLNVEQLIEEENELKPKSVSKNKKQKDRQKENMLIDKMRIEQLELEKQELAQKMQQFQQQQSQHAQWIEQSNRQYQDSLQAASTHKITQLESELANAAATFDSVRVAQINSELVRLQVQRELEKIKTPQYNNQPQAQQPQYNQYQQQPVAPQQHQISPDENLVRQRIIEFSNKPQNTWTNAEFYQDSSPKTQDAKVLTDIIKQVQSERGDWRTRSFWDIVEDRAAEALPHKYGNQDAPVAKSPPVGVAANKGISSVAGKASNDPSDVKVAEVVKLAMKEGLRFENKEEMRAFIRDTKNGMKNNSRWL